MKARLARLVAALTAAVEMTRWGRNRACARGRRTCWECNRLLQMLTLARGGATREEWLAMLSSIDQDTDTLSRLAAVALHPDRERLLSGLDPAARADVEHAVAVYTGRPS